MPVSASSSLALLLPACMRPRRSEDGRRMPLHRHCEATCLDRRSRTWASFCGRCREELGFASVIGQAIVIVMCEHAWVTCLHEMDGDGDGDGDGDIGDEKWKS